MSQSAKKKTTNTKSKTVKTAKPRSAAKNSNYGNPALGLLLFLCGGFAFLGYFTDEHWLVNALSLYVLKGLFGWGFLLAPPALIYGGFLLMLRAERSKQRTVCLIFMPALLGGIVHLIRCGTQYSLRYTSAAQFYTTGVSMSSGGLASGYLAEFLRDAISAYGAMPLLVILFFIFGFSALGVQWKDLIDSSPKKQEDKEKKNPAKVNEKAKQAVILPAEELPTIMRGKRGKKPQAIDITVDEKPKSPLRKKKKPASQAEPVDTPEDIPPIPQGYQASKEVKDNADLDALLDKMEKDTEVKSRRKAGKAVSPSPLIVDALPSSPPPMEGEREKLSHDEVRQATYEVAEEIGNADKPEAYVFPPLELLAPVQSASSANMDEVRTNRDRLNTCLKSFNVGATVTNVTVGPTVTRYDLELEAGLRLNKLTNLAGDLALSLGVDNVRIAPVPDKISTMGVEVPNRDTSLVGLREILQSNAFRTAKSALSFAIGKNISGDCIVGDISKLPHMLIAGTTGSGKSVCMNCLLLSLLYRSSPEEVRLIMIDPKIVELQIYNGIPHLYIPVVTEPKKAAGALQWSVNEMTKRYRLFAERNVRDLKGYNEARKMNGEETMPNLVIVIDELADLMMTAAKEVEDSICRVAQMGRAAGVHLIIATQRPSSEVITGLMKANIPSRIAFAVSSALESRIIMDQSGAEKLVGKGDMLYSPIGMGKPQRIQCAYVSDEEREAVVSFIKQSGEAQYDQLAMKEIDQKVAEKEREKDKSSAPRSAVADAIVADAQDNFLAGYDPLIAKAVEIIIEAKQGSVSLLQRRLNVGFARAGRIMDEMEELGIVGSAQGTKTRVVLVSREKWEARLNGTKTEGEKLMEASKDDFSLEEDTE